MNSEQYLEPSKPLVSTASLFGAYPVPKKVKGMGERQALICSICAELGIETKYRSGLYWQCKDMTDAEIVAIKHEALGWKVNSAALFRKLVRLKRLAIKAQLNEGS